MDHRPSLASRRKHRQVEAVSSIRFRDAAAGMPHACACHATTLKKKNSGPKRSRFTNRNMTSHILRTGACENVLSGLRRCALKASDCQPTHIDGEKNVNGEKWLASYTLELRGEVACSCETTEVGACAGGSVAEGLSFRCGTSPFSCQGDEIFGRLDFEFPDHKTCTCAGVGSYEMSTSNEIRQVESGYTHTLYGACQNSETREQYFCAHTPSDCEDDHIWIEPFNVQEVFGTECHCEHVRTGGCTGGMAGFYCALSEDDCPWGPYLPPLSLKKSSGETCHMCTATSKEIPMDEIDTAGGMTTGGKAAISVAAALLLGFLALSLIVWKCRASKSTTATEIASDKDGEIKDFA